MKQYWVAWENLLNPKHKGHGDWNPGKKLIEAGVFKGNRDYPDLHHWLEGKP